VTPDTCRWRGPEEIFTAAEAVGTLDGFGFVTPFGLKLPFSSGLMLLRAAQSHQERGPADGHRTEQHVAADLDDGRAGMGRAAQL
jgi:hypothetical protein